MTAGISAPGDRKVFAIPPNDPNWSSPPAQATFTADAELVWMMPHMHLRGKDMTYLLEYPEAKSENIQSEFYWEKVNFGLKPTLRIVQAVVYRGPRSTDPAYAVAVKQLYASHYFETALDLTVCVRDQENPDRGFYVITLKGSQQAGLTGLKGGIVRKVAVDKTRSSLERALGAIKQKLETRTD